MPRGKLAAYRKKRDFQRTPEPAGMVREVSGNRFVVHEHHAGRLHFDLRLEVGGVLKCWAVPKGPSMNPADRRLAVQTEDHPVEYLDFQGRIEEGQYGAGDMVIWDQGHYRPARLRRAAPGFDGLQGMEKGKLHIILSGKKLHGEFILVRAGPAAARDDRNWLLFKKRDEEAEADWKPALILPYGSRREKPEGLGAAGPMAGPTPPSRRTTASKPSPRASKRRAPKAAVIRKWPSGARPAPLPAFIEPMSAKLADKPFSDPDWVFETKWDGWRALLRIENGVGKLISRNRGSLDAMFPELGELPASVGASNCIIDGEVVALDEGGLPRFQLLQNRLKGKHPRNGGVMVYYAFDLPHLDGHDLTGCTLLERKELLRKIMRPSERFRYSEHFEERGKDIFAKAVGLGFEGVMAKRKDSPYRKVRSADWLKIKARRRQEVVIAGYTQPRRSRRFFGALVAGVCEGDRLVFAGHVGGGFDARQLKQTYELLEPLETAKCPFDDRPKTNEKVQWLKPEKVAEVEFTEWTADGRMRMPIFMGLRPDKDPRQCVREKEQPAFSNLEKVFWPDEGYTKGDLIEYYRKVSPYILPHLKDRPLILKRHPDGIKGFSFFQHDVKTAPPFVSLYPIEESSGTVSYALCQNQETLLYLANLGTIAQNPWLSRVPHLQRPDWTVIDLDPQEVEFPTVCEMAVYLHGVCERLGLKVFLKTSGSRGIHLYIPLQPRYSFQQSLGFAQLLAAHAIREKPDHFTAQRSLKSRNKRLIYLDCMQNSLGKSVASVYSARARPGACVSAPVTLAELKRKVSMEDFDIRTMPKRLEKQGDMFREVLKVRNSLSAAMGKLEKLLGKDGKMAKKR